MIAVVGAGAWGTALAQLLASREPVLLWARDPALATAINETHQNARHIPGLNLPERVLATSATADLATCDAWLVAVPAQHLRAVLSRSPLAHAPALLLCAKGIEAGTRLLMSEVAAAVAPRSSLAVLSGPSFAQEVAAGRPTAVALACASSAAAAAWQARLARPAFRPYLTDDVVGTEIGGAVKNVLAIASGVVAGCGLGESARAALISRGFTEMTRFGVARGARVETMAGLSGLGDLVLTCGSPASRNMSLGLAIGQGQRAADVLAARASVAEGATTAPVLVTAARVAGVEMPIAEAVADLLADRVSVDATIERLLSRPLGRET